MSLSPDLYSAMLASLGPQPPSKFTDAYKDQVFERLCKRRDALDGRVEASTQGRVIPDYDDLAIGEGKHFDELAVVFLDICHFSNLPNWTTEEQKLVLQTLNLFMGEMLTIVRDFGGTFEKNTGDGLMAYFGEGSRTTAEAIKPAVEAAVVMHHVNDHYLPFFLRKMGCQPVRFRIGIDSGPLTLAKVAIHGGSHGSILAIGSIANVACKMMKLIPDGGICIGERAYEALPNGWKSSCKVLTGSTGHVYKPSESPYPAYSMDYRAPYAPFATIPTSR